MEKAYPKVIFPNTNNIKRIAVLTSGGDAPGMNAAIRSVTRTALSMGLAVYGVEEGYRGLKEGKLKKFTSGSVGDIIQRGGTILRTARLPEFEFDREIRDTCYLNLRRRGIDALVVLGGDGSFQGAQLLAKENPLLRVIGIPCTIDNDIAYTDHTIGFDTAVNTCVNCINNLRDTMASHERISVVEVMGRHCGDIAVYAGIAAGAEAIIIPEIHHTTEEWVDYIEEKLAQSRRRQKQYGIIIIAEGMRLQKDSAELTAEYVSQRINQKMKGMSLDSEARPVVLAHIQRGGSPTMSDRILASRLGYHAVRLLMGGQNRRCVGIRGSDVVDEDIGVAVAMRREPKYELIALADMLAK